MGWILPKKQGLISVIEANTLRALFQLKEKQKWMQR